MWFKKREKDYTPEEAADLARKEFAPFWFRSQPLVCGAELEDGTVNPQPLDPAIRKGLWVLIFTESAGASLLRGTELLREWERRFTAVGVKFVFVFRARYSFLKKKRGAESWLSQNEMETIAYSDTTGHLMRAFAKPGEEPDNYPRVVILKDGGILFNHSGPRWLEGAEPTLASALRETSPGLPLWPEFLEPNATLIDCGRWTPRQPNDFVQFSGKWSKEEDRIITGDPTAEVRIRCPGNQLTLVAQSYTEELTPTRVFYHSQGSYFSDQQAGKDFVVDDEGRSSVILSSPQAYSVLAKLGDHQREVTFQFPNARVTSVAIYAFEFSDTIVQRV